jgi:hypothetical protein
MVTGGCLQTVAIEAIEVKILGAGGNNQTYVLNLGC